VNVLPVDTPNARKRTMMRRLMSDVDFCVCGPKSKLRKQSVTQTFRFVMLRLTASSEWAMGRAENIVDADPKPSQSRSEAGAWMCVELRYTRDENNAHARHNAFQERIHQHQLETM